MGRIRLTGLAISRVAALALPVAALVAVVASTPHAARAAESNDGLPQQTLQDCQRIPDATARLACYDRVMKSGNATMAPPATSPSATGASSGPATKATNASANGASAGAASQAKAPPPPPTAAERKAAFGLPRSEQPGYKQEREASPDEVEITVASVGQLAAGMVSLTATDGAVWNQTGGAAPRHVPKPGDKVTIKRNFMGGYRCKLSRWEIVRCARAR